jgi:hypothetical protein
MMLRVLDGEPLLIFHPEVRRGYRAEISGIADNFQLHTLLSDALVGNPAEGRLPGERPDPRVVAAARDGAAGRDTPSARGAFNLWTWLGLRPDGTLPDAMKGSDHWVWNEGTPADIPPFEGVRVVLLGPPPYPRSWSPERRFRDMAGELRLLEQLPTDAVQGWLRRIAAAPRPV